MDFHPVFPSRKPIQMKKTIRENRMTILLMLILFLGLGIALYPSFANWWNSYYASHAIASYVDDLSGMEEVSKEEILNNARAYNEKLTDIQKTNGLYLPDDMTEEYDSMLNTSRTGIMGYIEIKKISVNLPIYHGTSDSTLTIAVGHLSGTSLPVGGESTHAVLSGHRGLPNAKLFTDLDKLVVGDTFMIYTLDETLTYEVDQIRIVLPDEVSELKIQEGEDLCTLVTCTPYAVNTHRLLVRGHRIPNELSTSSVTSEALQVDTKIVALILAVPILVVLLIVMLARGNRKKS